MEDTQIKQLVMSTYNNIAKVYQSEYSEIDALDREKWGCFLDLCKGKKVLDLGCGTGEGTEFLLSKGCIPTGVDFSDGMLEIAKKVSDEIEWVKSDICSLPFQDKSYSGVVIAYTINHLTYDMLCTAKSEIDRVLDEDGVILLVFHVGDKEETIPDPADSSLSIYYHYYTKEQLEDIFYNYITIDYYQRASLALSELTNDKGTLTMRRITGKLG